MNHQTMTQKPSVEDIRTLEDLRLKLMPLCTNIFKLKMQMANNPGNPPSWPDIERATAVLNNQLLSLQQMIDGHVTKTTEADGDITRTPVPPKAPILQALHPYPMPPFPMDKHEGLSETLLRKKLGTEEENWVLHRLQVASEFCHVPSDWGIEPRKGGGHGDDGGSGDDGGNGSDDNDDDVDEDGDDGGNDGKKKFKPTKAQRRKGALSEEELRDVWHSGMYEASFGISQVDPDGGSASGESGEDDESEEEDQGKDVKMEDSEPIRTQIGGAGQSSGAVVQQPPIPVDAVLKFISIGATDQAQSAPSGQPAQPAR